MSQFTSPLTDAQRTARDAAITDLVKNHCSTGDADLYGSMIRTICRLAADNASRADAKLIDRALAELRYAFKTFTPYEHIPKVTIFGSARTAETHPEYQQALKFAELIRKQNWMVITGAGDGIMKAGHGGAGAEASFGVAIRLPFEQKTNTIIATDKKLVNFNYFFTRKLMFMKEAKAVVLFPGGFGTQDEGFEALTLVQTGKAMLVPIVMVDAPGGTYWQHWRTYVKAELLHTGMIGADDMNLIRITDDVESAVQEIVQFYKRFHSYRYVRDRLVIRMNEPISDAALAHIREHFTDICDSGTIERIGVVDEERDEFPEKPRITMHFNRRAHGRLRQMINYINAVGEPSVVSGGASR